MRELTMEQFEARFNAFDKRVTQTPDIDQFCSSSAWIMPARKAFLPEHTLFLRECDHGFIALARGYDLQLGHYLHPLEASWALACPIIGQNSVELTARFVELCHRQSQPWNLLFLSGISPNSILLQQLINGFRHAYSIGIGSSVKRRIASLSGGLDGFYARRSASFRANLRRAERRALQAGIEVEYFQVIDPEQQCHQLFQRALQLERHSWKGQAETGIIDGPMRVFYNDMLPRLSQNNTLRFVFLTLDGVDIAYCFGAVFNRSFRGLQMSYHDDYRKFSPGSLAQLAMLKKLCDEEITSYDLGSEMPYKFDWAEEVMETIALIVRR